jgi:hypothetical protein
MKKNDRVGDWEEREVHDRNRDGIDDAIAPEQPDVRAGSRKLRERLDENTNTDPSLSGGDVDAQWDMAESTGDEAVAGSMPTPGQSVVQEIGEAIGVTYQDNEELRAGEKERDRDRSRWELDPASSEDYIDRTRDGKK